MKKVFICIILTFACMTTVFAQKETRSSEAMGHISNWHKYSSEEINSLKFSILYPYDNDFSKSWEVDIKSKYMIIFVSPDGFKTFVMVNIKDSTKFSDDIPTLDEYLDINDQNNSEATKNYRLYSKEKVQLAGHEAGLLDYSFIDPLNNHQHIKSFFLIVDKNVYDIVYISSAKNYDTYLSVADKIIKSFTFE